MSFSSEFESLLAELESRWQQLDCSLSNSGPSQLHGNKIELSFKDFEEPIHEFLASLQQVQKGYVQHQHRFSKLESDLTLDLENLRSCAIDYFSKGQYNECARLLSFLGKIEDHENLERLFDTDRRLLELEDTGSESVETNVLPGSEISMEDRDAETLAPIDGSATASSSHSRRPSAHQAKGFEPFCAVEESNTESCQTTTEPLAHAHQLTPLRATLGARPCLEIEPNRTFAPIENANIWTRLNPSMEDLPGDRRFRVWRRRVLPMATAAVMFWVLAEVLSPLSEQPQGTPTAEPMVMEDLRLQAQDLYEAGKLQDADQICTRILAKQEDDIFALALKDAIRKSLFEKRPEIARPVSETIQEHLLLGSVPGERSINEPSHRDSATASSLASKLAKPVSESPKTSLPRRMPQILVTHVAVAHPTPPLKSQPLRQREESAKPVAAPVASSGTLRELNNKIQSHKPEQAQALLTNRETGFNGSSEAKTISHKLEKEEGKQQSLAMSLLQKAESALIVGHYVTPDHENVLAYCNQTLKLDAQNRRALEMKKAVVLRAVAQARDWILRGRFDSARAYFASLDNFALNDSEFPYPKAELKQELQKLEFKSYPMVHEHRLGSCSGKLRMNAYVISYVPSDDSGDGFTERLRSAVVAEDRDRLRISYGGTNLRFRPDRFSGGQDDSAARNFYRQWITLRVDERLMLTVSQNKPPS